MIKDRLLTALKIVISLGLIVYLLFKVDFNVVAATIRSANYVNLSFAILLYAGAVIAGGLKWYILLRAQRIPISFWGLLGYTFVGVFFNNFLPANVGGDVMRGYGLARYTDRAAEAAVSVVVDRVVGLIAFMSAAFASSVAAVFLIGRQELLTIVIVSGAATLAIASLFAAVLSRRIRAWVERLFAIRILARFAALYHRLSDALTFYRFKFDRLFMAYCVSLLTLALSNFSIYVTAEALGGGVPLWAIFLFNPLIAFVLLIPISVGGLGLNQGAFVFFYGLAGIPSKVIFPVSLVMQFIIYLTSLPGGFLWQRSKRRPAAIADPSGPRLQPDDLKVP